MRDLPELPRGAVDKESNTKESLIGGEVTTGSRYVSPATEAMLLRAVQLGILSASKAGNAWPAKLSDQWRKVIARKAAVVGWGKE